MACYDQNAHIVIASRSVTCRWEARDRLSAAVTTAVRREDLGWAAARDCAQQVPAGRGADRRVAGERRLRDRVQRSAVGTDACRTRQGSAYRTPRNTGTRRQSSVWRL